MDATHSVHLKKRFYDEAKRSPQKCVFRSSIVLICIEYPWARSPFVSIVPSLGEFPGYWDRLRYPGLPPALVTLVSITFPLSPSISRCFSLHCSPAIGFHSCFFFTTDVSAPIRSTLHLLMVSFQDWDTPLYPMLWSQRRSYYLVSHLLPGPLHLYWS